MEGCFHMIISRDHPYILIHLKKYIFLFILATRLLLFTVTLPHVQERFGITDDRKDVRLGAHLPLVEQLEWRYTSRDV